MALMPQQPDRKPRQISCVVDGAWTPWEGVASPHMNPARDTVASSPIDPCSQCHTCEALHVSIPVGGTGPEWAPQGILQGQAAEEVTVTVTALFWQRRKALLGDPALVCS